ncbi:MAG: primosomal protein N' [Vampirovibrionales bacterium]
MLSLGSSFHGMLNPSAPLWVEVWVAGQYIRQTSREDTLSEVRSEASTMVADDTLSSGCLTYQWSSSLGKVLPKVGQCVLVPLRQKNHVLGVIVGITHVPPAFMTRPVQQVYQDYFLFDASYHTYLAWVSMYYGVSLQECMTMALPSAVLVAPVVKYAPYQSEGLLLREGTHQAQVYQALQTLYAQSATPKTLAQIQLKLRQDSTMPSLKKAQLLRALETLVQKQYIVRSMAPEWSVARAVSPRKTATAINLSQLAQAPVLTAEQAHVLETLRQQDDMQRVQGMVVPQLLHGVTGSGKTEIYLQRILDVLTQALEENPSKPVQVLVLVPEIVLTTQLLQRFEARIGRGAVKPWHSKLSTSERQATWYGVYTGKVSCVLGARSAVWLPFKRLRLIILDECHESSFRQDTLAPRYDARLLAMYQAHHHQAQLILGSATPTVEQLYYALTLKTWGYHRLAERPTHHPLPEVHFIDPLTHPNERYLELPTPKVSETLTQEEMTQSPSQVWQQALSRTLVKKLRHTLQQGHQAVLLLNRRGYHQVLFCEACRTTLQCPHCSVSLTLHKFYIQKMAQYVAVCHQCDYRMPQPASCPSCDMPSLKPFGGGSQKLEETLQTFVPEARIARLDRDTTQRKHAVSEVLQQMQEGTLNTLIGTQMIAKGLDLPKVSLVGVLEADATLWMPDFQMNERVFQLVTQVAGRAGRGDVAGEVYIETMQPQHPVLQYAKAQDTLGFYAWERSEHREPLRYPPYSQLARWIFSSPHITPLESLQQTLQQALEAYPELPPPLGPVACPIAKLQNRWRCHWVWKLPPASAMLPERLQPSQAHAHLIHVTQTLQQTYQPLLNAHEIRWLLELDPISLR